jgi:DNA adenine methylase
MTQLVPLLKWAGGKRWLIPHAKDIFPTSYNRYIEPFLGGGAVFFHLRPEHSILSDINQELIDTYTAIRENWRLVQSHLEKHQNLHCKEYYYKIRASKPRTLATRAARMLYLNRTCWNGLYRLNLKGEFNVPIGTKTSVLLDSDNFDAASCLLKKSILSSCDFEETIEKATNGDFLFIDPPYTVKHNLNGFIKYNENLFSWDDQIRLRNATMRAANRNVKITVSNAAHESVKELYKDFQWVEIPRKSILSGDPKYRVDTAELIIRHW